MPLTVKVNTQFYEKPVNQKVLVISSQLAHDS